MATELTLNLGKQWLASNPISGATMYAGLVHAKAVNTADSGSYILATSTVSTIGEITGTGYARQSFVMGAADTAGIMAVPQIIWDVGSATDWPSDVSGWFMATAVTAGIAVFVWDLGVRSGATGSGTKPVTAVSVPTVDLATSGKVWGPGIAAGTTVASITSGSAIMLSANANASATVNLSFSRNASQNSRITLPSDNFFFKNPGE